MEEYKVSKLEEKDFARWDRFLSDSPYCSIFSSSLWLKVLNKAKDGNAKIIAVFKKDEIVGGTLIFIRKKGPLKVIAYPPLTEFTPVIHKKNVSNKISKIESNHKKIESLLSDYLTKKYHLVSLILHPDNKDIRNFIWLNWKTKINYTYETDISDLNKLWDSLGKKVKYEIKKANKLKLKFYSNKDVDSFYDLYQKTFLRQKLSAPIKKEFIQELFKILDQEDICKLYFVEKENKKIATAMVIWYNNKAYYLLAASDNSQNYGAPSFLIWNLFKEISGKIKIIDLCGANTEHLVKFKRDFASRIVPYYCVEKSSALMSFIMRLYLFFN